MTRHDMSTNPFDYIHVPVQTDTYDAFLRVLDEGEHPIAVLEELLQEFWNERFERLDSLGPLQSEYTTNEELRVQQQAWTAHYGDPAEGCFWDRVFLRNSTKLRTRYKGREYFAEVRHSQIWFRNESTTPSKFANAAANNTIRNAWRDLSVLFLGEDWKSAETLRHNPPARSRLDVDIWAAAVADYNGINGAPMKQEGEKDE